MKQRIITSVIVLSLLATMTTWGQRTMIKRTATQKTSQGKAGGLWYYGYRFSEGLARVANHNYEDGFINKTGQQMIPYKWLEAGDFSEGLTWVRNSNDRCHIINKQGQIVK